MISLSKALLILFLTFWTFAAECNNTININNSWNYSDEFDLNKEELKQFELKWYLEYDDSAYINQAPPKYYKNVIITKKNSNTIAAIDIHTGLIVWEKKFKGEVAKRGFAINADIIYLPAERGIFLLNASNGTLHKRYLKNAFIKSGTTFLEPVINRDQIYIATVSGKVKAYNLINGNKIWEISLEKDNVTPRIWSGFSSSSDKETLLVNTSNPGGFYGKKFTDGGFSNSVIAISSKKGEIKWSFQETSHDIWDWDLMGKPIEIEYQNHRAVAALSKRGNLMILNLEDGKLLSKSIKKKVPSSDIPGEKTSEYQKFFIHPKPFVVNDAENLISSNKNSLFVKIKIRKANGEEFLPPMLKQDSLQYGIDGGANLFGGAYDPYDKNLVVPSNKIPFIYRTNFLLKKEDKNINKIFKSNRFKKCIACHGKNGFGNHQDELTGDGYFPSLIGITLKYPNNKFLTEKEFKNIHLYSNFGNNKQLRQNMNISDNFEKDFRFSKSEVNDFYSFFEEIDKLAISKDNLHINPIYSILLDKDNEIITGKNLGNINLYNMNDGSLQWQKPFGEAFDSRNTGDINFGGISMSRELIFTTGSRTNKLYAYDKKGNLLWGYKMKSAGSSPPLLFVSKNCPYVSVNSSGGKYIGFKKNEKKGLYLFSKKGC